MKSKIDITSYHVSDGQVDTLYFNYRFHSYVAQISYPHISVLKKDQKRTNVAHIDMKAKKLTPANGLDELTSQIFENAILGTVEYINSNSIKEYLLP